MSQTSKSSKLASTKSAGQHGKGVQEHPEHSSVEDSNTQGQHEEQEQVQHVLRTSVTKSRKRRNKRQAGVVKTRQPRRSRAMSASECEPNDDDVHLTAAQFWLELCLLYKRQHGGVKKARTTAMGATSTTPTV